MFLVAFLAGSFVPFSSEAVMSALLITTDINPVLTVAAATVGNVLGSMFNYGVGRLGDAERLSHWLKVKTRRMEQAKRWTAKYGAWIGFFAFLPVIGIAICIMLGVMRANFLAVTCTISAGKLFRYILVASTTMALF